MDLTNIGQQVWQRYGSVILLFWGQIIDKTTILIQAKHVSLVGNDYCS